MIGNISNKCKKCKALNNQYTVQCAICGTDNQGWPDASKIEAKRRNKLAITSFVLSLIPPVPLIIFAIYLAAVNMGASTDGVLSFLGVLLLMLFLGLSLYLGTYIISIPALILSIKALKSERKKLAIAGIIISIFNFSIPFLVSPVNELFLR